MQDSRRRGDRPQPYWPAVRIGLVLAGIGLSLAGLLYARRSAFLSKTESAIGAVVEVRRSPAAKGGSDLYHPEIRFRTRTGETITFHSRTESFLSPSYRAGQELPIRYDPDVPTKAIIDDFSHKWVGVCLSVLLGLFGLCLCAAKHREQDAANINAEELKQLEAGDS